MAETNHATWEAAAAALADQRFADAERLFAELQVLKPGSLSIRQYLDRARGFAPHFAELLRERDGGTPRKRIYIMGCGRSGTTMLMSMMRCFADTFVLIDPERGGEDSIGRFATLDAPERVHVIKRDAIAHQYAHLIPDCIDILHIVRHPLDVLVSDLKLDKTWERYIKPDRWEPEMASLQALIDRRPMLIVRYEDLVADPDRVQAVIESGFDLRPSIPFSRFHQSFEPAKIIADTMNGVRAPSTASIDRWSRTSDNIDYCRSLWPEIRSQVEWVCERFGYDFGVISSTLG
jgi:hypothetical protein